MRETSSGDVGVSVGQDGNLGVELSAIDAQTKPRSSRLFSSRHEDSIAIRTHRRGQLDD